MGVKGWNRFLAEEGWIPDDSEGPCCPISLFGLPQNPFTSSNTPTVEQLTSYTVGVDIGGANRNDYYTEQKRAPRVIPAQSEFHVDGNGLCFYLVKTAYARHMNTILYGKWNRHQCPCVHTTPLQLTAQQARHLMPFFIPLKLIADVTSEFVTTLRDDHNISLFIYWDGSERYIYKQDTDQKRRSDRNEDWSNLHQYCLHGTLPPFNHRSKTSSCDYFLKQFPLSKLYSAQIFHAFHSMYKVPCIQCPNEADTILAQQVSQKQNSYIIAFDSDFCFYSRVQYIPITTLQIRKNHTEKGVLLAQVLSRELFAESLRLPDSKVMVELAILLGNDYISPSTANNNHDWSNGMNSSRVPGKVNDHSSRSRGHNNWSAIFNDIVSFLQNQNADFLLRSSCSETEQKIQFIRQLYNLNLPDKSSGLVTSYLLSDIVASQDDPSNAIESRRPHVTHAELDALDIKIDSSRETIKKAIIHSLQVHVSNCVAVNGNDVIPRNEHYSSSNVLQCLRQEHVVALAGVSMHGNADDGSEKTWRPLWLDVNAMYLIEKIVLRIYESYSFQKGPLHDFSSVVLLLNPPYAVFDPYKYHLHLCIIRNRSENLHASIRTMSPSTDIPKMKIGERQRQSAISNDSVSHLEGNDSLNNVLDERPVLPVDEFENEILSSVYRNRVTIIQGETGCGKSSRIPVMLLRAPPPSDSPHKEAKLFVSQPRRIATKALVEHLRKMEPDLRDQIALRMGHGVREYETSSTRALFVTVGYLIRLLINIPDRFNKVTYLILDEVHERSVDMDVLCLLCRRLLSANNHTRLILMSATLAARIYQEYFNVKDPVIYVGARRFPVEEVFLSDLPRSVKFSGNVTSKISALSKEVLDMKCLRAPSVSYMDKLFAVVANLAVVVGKPGTSVLIFVSGINDIICISEIIEQLNIPGTVFTCLPIHGDIPFEDQMHVFDMAKPNEVKIIISTNAAESSVTLPDVDNVICLGLCKQIEYNPISHRQMLVPTWISRASAIQRAGRTGRLRPGTVYRLYEKSTYNFHMEAFERGEMLRIPLDSVILTLKQMLTDDCVSEVLASCLEPPNTSTIDRSFQSLFQSNLISEALDVDSCKITTLGRFVSQLGIELALGSLIGLGIQFGVGAETILIAGILSFPKGPWIQSSPLVHGTKEFNDMSVKTFASRCHFDANLFSEPLAVMNVLWEYGQTPSPEKQNWCTKHGIFLPRIKRLDATCRSLQERVADYFDIPKHRLEVTIPPMQMPHSMITVLRVIQFWVFHDTLIQFDPSKIVVSQARKDQYTIKIEGSRSDPVKPEHLKQIFKDPQQHPFTLCREFTVHQKGSFSVSVEPRSPQLDFLAGFQERVISFSTECKYALVNVEFHDCFIAYVDEKTRGDLFDAIPTLSTDSKDIAFSFVKAMPQPTGKALRGRYERPCGLWIVTSMTSCTTTVAREETEVLWFVILFKKTKAGKTLLNTYISECESYLSARKISTAQRRLAFNFSCGSILDRKTACVNFNLTVVGEEKGISDLDLKDLFSSSAITSNRKSKQLSQFLIFPTVAIGALSESPATIDPCQRWYRPTIDCIPEAARLASVLASSQRSEHCLKLIPPSGENEALTDTSPSLLLYLNKQQTNVRSRWKRFGTTQQAYIEANSVPGSAVPMHELDMLYCVCANTLEMKGGAIKAEGLTLLPPGKLFLQLCRFTFGLYKQENVEDETILLVDSNKARMNDKKLRQRIKRAVSFHKSSIALGETLKCFPEKVEELINIFDGVDGYPFGTLPWKGLASNPFLAKYRDI